MATTSQLLVKVFAVGSVSLPAKLGAMSIGVWKKPEVTAPIMVTERTNATMDSRALQPEYAKTIRPATGSRWATRTKFVTRLQSQVHMSKPLHFMFYWSFLPAIARCRSA